MQGIYRIICTVSGRSYVGSAADIDSRWRTHRHQLNHNKHHSIALQRAWVKYGESSFEWIVLEETTEDARYIREQWWIDHLHAYNGGYNCTPEAGSPRGRKWTPEQRQAQSERLKGRKHTPEALEKQAAAKRGKPRGAATKAKLSAYMNSPQGIAQREATHVGTKRSPETCKRISEAKKGKKHREPFSKEARKNMSLARKAWWDHKKQQQEGNFTP